MVKLPEQLGAVNAPVTVAPESGSAAFTVPPIPDPVTLVTVTLPEVAVLSAATAQPCPVPAEPPFFVTATIASRKLPFASGAGRLAALRRARSTTVYVPAPIVCGWPFGFSFTTVISTVVAFASRCPCCSSWQRSAELEERPTAAAPPPTVTPTTPGGVQ